MIGDHPIRLYVNPRQGVPGVVVLTEGGFRRAVAEITAWPAYAPTPLRELPPQGFASLHYKDEAGRFGLGSFKALGGAYAVQKLVVGELARADIRATGAEVFAGRHASGVTVTCATDGNHGRSVAWGAQRFHCRCVIFVHETVSQGRVDLGLIPALHALPMPLPVAHFRSPPLGRLSMMNSPDFGLLSA